MTGFSYGQAVTAREAAHAAAMRERQRVTTVVQIQQPARPHGLRSHITSPA
jgi:hypothetical protein